MPATINLMNTKEVIPCIFYFYLHYKLREKYEDTVVSVKDAMSFLFEWRLPKEIRPIIIKELEMLNLIERVNKKTIRISKSQFILEDTRDFYKIVGIF